MNKLKALFLFALIFIFTANAPAYAGDWVKLNSSGTKVWVDTSHWETKQRWVTSGYWTTQRVWVPEQGHWEKYWVDTSHWETGQVWVQSGYWDTRQVWVDTSHYETRQVWVDTSHYETRRVWVDTSHWEYRKVWVDTSHWEYRKVWVESGYWKKITKKAWKPFNTSKNGWGFVDWKSGYWEIQEEWVWVDTSHFEIQKVWVKDGYWNMEKIWVKDGYWKTEKVWVKSGYWKTEKVWVQSGYWDTEPVWVDTSHYETRQVWVQDGYWAQRWVVDVPGHYETRQVWVDTSHWETYREWVKSGYWDEVHGTISVSKTPQYVFTNKHTLPDGSVCDMTLNISYALNKKVANIRAVHVVNRYQNKGVLYVEPYSAVKNVGGTSGSAVLKFQYEKPGDENSTLHVYFDLEGGGSFEIQMNIPINGIYADSKFNIPDPVFKKSIKDSEVITF
ncbi:hypothetical protein [Thermoanaerobacter uzonensis]|uniref:hypothetical protein n=1 Tax=Thermoanaerobacter uzonensis TaxID=447593 RepID=UPI003D768A71